MPASAPPVRAVPARALPPSRNNNFNFLRLFFASLVLLSHAPELRDGNRSREILTRIFGSISFGELAVNGFFLLSGYLIVQSWHQGPQLRSFFSKRIRRIYPAFVVAALLCLVVVVPLAVPDAAHTLRSINYWQQFVRVIQLHPPDVPGIFAGTPNPLLNGAMGTVAYEFHCYAYAALIGLAGVRRQKSIWLTLLGICIVLWQLPGQLGQLDFRGLHLLVLNPVMFVRFFALFCAGACFYVFRNELPLRADWAALAALLTGILLFFPAVAQLALATTGAYALFWVAFAHIPWLDRFKQLDDISYGLYLYGWPLQKLADWYFPGVSTWVLLPFVFLAACLAGYLSWHIVEARFLKRRHPPRPAL